MIMRDWSYEHFNFCNCYYSLNFLDILQTGKNRKSELFNFVDLNRNSMIALSLYHYCVKNLIYSKKLCYDYNLKK